MSHIIFAECRTCEVQGEFEGGKKCPTCDSELIELTLVPTAELEALRGLISEMNKINEASDGEGCGAWSINGDLQKRIDEVLK